MRLFVDLLCLQSPDARADLTQHTIRLLRQARTFLPGRVEIIGLCDPSSATLSPLASGLCDRLQATRAIGQGVAPAIFLQPAPLLGDPTLDGPLLGRADILSCAIVQDFSPFAQQAASPLQRRRHLASLYWLELYDLFSTFSYQDGLFLQRELGVRADSLVTTGSSVGPAFAHFDDLRAFAMPHPTRFAVGRYYVLPHASPQSLEAILIAHARVTFSEVQPLGLVVLGSVSDAQRKRLLRQYLRAGGRAQNVEFLGPLPDAARAALFHRAVGCVVLAADGFSVAAVEAMACGCPVVAEDSAGHRELLQRHALFQVDDRAGVIDALERLLTQPTWAEQLRQEQAGAALRYREEEVARRFWQHIVRHLPSAPAILRERLRKPRLAILTPYPPQRCQAADYTAESLRALARLATIDVYTDAPAPARPECVRHLYPISDLAYQSSDYDRVLAVVGNSPHSAPILQRLERYGGPCLLHDEHLLDYYCGKHGITGAAEWASARLGRRVRPGEVHEWLLDSGGQTPNLFLDEVVHRAAPLLVHSRGMQRQLARRYAAEAICLPYCSPLRWQRDELSDVSRQAARERLQVPLERLLVVMPGPFERRTGPLEGAWAVELLRSWGVDVELHLLDRLDEQLAEELPDLEGALRLPAGAMAERAYRDALLAADIALVLRGPGFGQPSRALVDCITAGLATIASEDIAESLEAPEYVSRVPDHLSPLLIAEQILEAQKAGSARMRERPERAEYVRRHDFEHYARALLEALGLAACGGKLAV